MAMFHSIYEYRHGPIHIYVQTPGMSLETVVRWTAVCRAASTLPVMRKDALCSLRSCVYWEASSGQEIQVKREELWAMADLGCSWVSLFLGTYRVLWYL